MSSKLSQPSSPNDRIVDTIDGSSPMSSESDLEAQSAELPYLSAELEVQLERFQVLVQRQDPNDRLALDYEWAWRYQGSNDEELSLSATSEELSTQKKTGFHLGVSVMIHGNEVGPLVGLLDIMEALDSGKISFPGTFTCFVGNPEAGRLTRRFVDVDLNRVFEPTSLEREGVISHEVRRAQKLISILDEVDLYIDFHQTILDSAQPFYISPWQEEAWKWMRLMGGASVWVTRDPSQGGGGLKCADEYVRQRGRPSIALELGALGFSAQARSGVWRSLNRVMNAVSEINRDESDLLSLAMSQPELTFYETRSRYPFSDPALALAPGWVNFSPVQRGELLTTSHPTDSSLTRYAEESGALLFPKYPPRDAMGMALDPRPHELCRIVSPLEGHPLEMWGSERAVQPAHQDEPLPEMTGE